MGLDMYMYAVKKNSKADIALTNIKNDENARQEFYDSPELDKMEVCYWRKAWPIHKWFVRNVQNGVDDCNYYRVPKNDIFDLISALLFCFNGRKWLDINFSDCEYDLDVEMVTYTLKLLIDALAMNIDDEYNFYYLSSW